MIRYQKALSLPVLFFLSFTFLQAQSIKNYETNSGSDDALNFLFNLDLTPPPSGLNADKAGRIISSLGDLNGDGYDDWAIGLPISAEFSTGVMTGSVHIYFGSSTRRSNETPADMVIYGQYLEGLGTNVKAVGDVNNDGFDDMLVQYTDWNDDYTETKATWALYLGSSTFDSEADLQFTKSDEHEGYTNFASGAGDVNNDGYDDILLSIPTKIWGPDTAHVYLFMGGEVMDNIPDLIFTGQVSASGAYNFTGATGAGDVNNDGFDDVIISTSGGAELYFGGENMDKTADLHFSEFKGGGIGTGPGVGTAGDVNGDGYADILLTANVANSKALICLGGETVDNLPDIEIPIWTAETYFGLSHAAAGDMNKDGFDDILLGTNTEWSIDTGQVRLFYGGAQMDSIADVIVYGPQPGANFGFSCAGGGDFDGDGYKDFLAGELGATANFNEHDDPGSVSLFYGGTSISEHGDAVFTGNADNESFGGSVAHAGDVNKDGYEDLLVGAGNHWDGSNYTGRAYLYYGSVHHGAEPDLIFDSEAINTRSIFGKNLNGAGDINGDGYSDIYIEEEYKISIFLGGSPMDNVADYSITTPKINYSISALGDVNNDGFDDILYGDASAGNNGTAWLYLGGEDFLSAAAATYTGNNAGDNLGMMCSSAGDLNMDGFMDYMISAPGSDLAETNSGSVFVYLGQESISDNPDMTINGYYEDQGLGGGEIAAGGDLNNDGYDDFIIGDKNFSRTSSSFEGRAYIYHGGLVPDPDADLIFTGNTPGNKLGSKIRFLPDVNEDGFDELLMNDDFNQNSKGMAVFYGGNPMDSISDLFLPYSSTNDYAAYYEDKDSAVLLVIGDYYSRAAGPQSGRVIYYISRTIDTTTTNTSIPIINLPEGSLNLRNYPNPFKDHTTISYNLSEESFVELEIYNILGKKVRTLISQDQNAGSHYESFDAGDLKAGIYFYRLKAGRHVSAGKMSIQ